MIRGALERLPSRCPLCQMAARGGLLCDGCDGDTFQARQCRALCATCALDLPAAGPCPVCRPDPELAALVCAFDYAFAGQALINMYKEGRQLALARLLGEQMVRAIEPVLNLHHLDAWVPIPASHARLSRNGFSPAQQLARVVAAHTAIPSRLDWLKQIRDGIPQKTLSRRQRAIAAQGRFEADLAVSGRSIGIVDDVVTTASTVVAAAKALKAAGATRVIVLAAARTPQRA
jgi:ComF family protein